MFPPMLPLSAVPVTQQLDPVKPPPAIQPVVATQPTSNESTIDLSQREAEETALLLREEQRRRQRQRREREEQAKASDFHAVPGHELNADNTVPVAPLVEHAARQGMWVDIEI